MEGIVNTTAPGIGATKPSAAQSLRQLLVDMFTPGELKTFLGDYYSSTVQEVDWKQATNMLTLEVSDMLIRHGHVDSELFELIRALRPKRREEVKRVQRLWGLNASLPPEPCTSAPDSSPSGKTRVRLDVVLDRDFAHYRDQDAEMLRMALAGLLGVSPTSIKILGKEPGSVHVGLELDADAAAALQKMAQRGPPAFEKFKADFRVSSVAQVPTSANQMIALYAAGTRQFRWADLSRADLSRADLSRADLSRADLRGANLGRIDLHKALLRRADLRNASIILADLRGANLSGADLSGADLSGTDLCDAALSRTNLSKANLANINLNGAWLVFANLNGADLKGVNLRGTNLTGANLGGVDLRGADLSDADLSSADLSGANLSGTNLSGADFSVANLSGADLSGADLRGADLSEVQISSTERNAPRFISIRGVEPSRVDKAPRGGANLGHANLSRANLSRANLRHAKFDYAYLDNANLSGTLLDSNDESGAGVA